MKRELITRSLKVGDVYTVKFQCIRDCDVTVSFETADEDYLDISSRSVTETGYGVVPDYMAHLPDSEKIKLLGL